MTEDGLPPLREVIRDHGLAARKSLGQNFLLDLNLTDKIARAAGPLGDVDVVEVGPGPGGLTRSLLRYGARRVIAIERDRRCIPALCGIAAAYPGRLEIVEEDALSLDMAQLVSGPARVVANLPYNISTVLLGRWLETQPWPPWYVSLTLMFQREVAQRICAPAGSRSYGRLSVLAQWRCVVERLFDIPARAFMPAPKVTSTVVQFTPRPMPEPKCRVEALQQVAAAGFGQRRKMLRSSLKSLVRDPGELIERAGLDPQMRAERIDIAGFCRLANALDAVHNGASGGSIT
jgi:16S rRNA (adenine1518-N6/adenine1519-N6)-dimethyltransferase